MDVATYTGRRFGRYHLLERIGAGGMGEVYRARDDRLGREVAVKVIRADASVDVEARQRLRREADTLSTLNHPNIATIYDFDSHDDVDFVVMELVAGQTLGQRLDAMAFDEHEVLRLGAQIAHGLQEAHEHGVVHRDLKPGNVMLTPKGQVKLLDFGLAQRVSAADIAATATKAGGVAGTYPYMAPEQLRNQPVGPWTDVWALGVVLYELATGKRPFGGSDIGSIVDGILNRAPDPVNVVRPSVSPGLAQILQRALSKAPSARYQSAAEVGAALQALMAGSASSHGSWPALPAPPAAPRLSVGRWAVVGVVVAVVAAAGWWLARRPAAPPAAAAGLTVLIGGVENRTGDATFDALLPELLATTLEQSRAIAVYPRSNIGFVLRRMQRDPDTPIDEAVGREVCAREGLSAVIVQSITRLGTSLVLVLRAVQPDGRLLASAQETLPDVRELPARMDAMGNALREALGESAAAVAQASAPLDSVTSPSLDAVQFYSQGRQRLYAGDPRGAIVLLQRAVAIDPEFAMAHGALGVAYTNVQDIAAAGEQLRLAASYAARAPEAEREKILGDFAMTRRDFVAACPHFQVLVATRPRDPAAHLSLGWCSAWSLDFATAVAETEKAYELQPSPRTQINRAMVAFLSGDLQKALDNAAAVKAQVPGMMQAGYVTGRAHLARGDLDAARREYEAMIAQGGDAEMEGQAGLADVARSTGQLDEARRRLEAARASAGLGGNLTVATTAAAELAELALVTGRRQEYAAALATITAAPSDPWLVYRVGRARARAGESAAALRQLAAIDALSIGPSRQHDALRALIRAEVALAARSTAEAVREAEAAVRHEPSTVAHETLARAYVAAGRRDDAVRAFEQILSRPHQRCESYDAPACYRTLEAAYWIGRLKDEAGDRAGAEPHLRRFVTAWAGAAGQPMFDDASRRLAASR